MDLSIHSFKVPHQMNPGICRKWLAIHLRRDPFLIERVPDVPFARSSEIALCSPGPAQATKSLVHIKFKRLRFVRIINEEEEIVNKMGDIVATAQRLEPQLVGVSRGTTHGELGGFTIQRRITLPLSHRGYGIFQTRGANLAFTGLTRRKKGGTGLPAGQGLNGAD